jgi:hypothetical protein
VAPSDSSHEEKRQDEALNDPVEVDLAAERRLVRKLDLRLLPCLALTYLLAFIDVRSHFDRRFSISFY